MGNRPFLCGLLVLLLGVSELLAATYTVTQTGSLGAGSLRQAVLDAEANPGPDIIEFAPALAGQTVLLGHVGDSGNGFSALGINTEIEIRNTTGSNITIARDSASNYAMRIFNVRAGGNLKLVNVTIDNGSLTVIGGANIASAGTFTARGCTIKGGYVSYNTNPLTSGGGLLVTAGTATLINCTVTANYSGGQAGGIACNSGASLNVFNCTITGNNGSGTRDLVSSGTTVVRNAILGSNSFTAAIGSGNNIGAALALPVALAANGGPTETMAINFASPAAGAGVYDPEVLTDQRGMARHNPPDIGAFELQPVAPQITSANFATFIAGTSNSFTFTASGGPPPTFTTASSLPAGVTLSPSGVLSGAPSTGGVFPLTIIAANGAAPDATQAFTLTVGETSSLVVNTTTDAAVIDGITSLREALAYAQSLGGAQTITFAPALSGQNILLNAGATGASDDTALRVNSGILTIDGGAGVTLRMTVTGRRHLLVGGGAALTLKNLTMTGGDLRGVSDGAAVWNGGSLTINNCRLTGNQANNGGAVWSGGVLVMTTSLVESNSANANGGGVMSSGFLNISGCTFTRNSGQNEGGALHCWGYSPSLAIVNSTFAGNSAVANGGAIVTGANTNTLTNVTIVDNTAANGAYWQWQTPATFVNTIVARNFNGSTPSDIMTFGTGTLTAASGNNLIGAGGSGGLVNGVNGNMVGVAPANLFLGTLANNGGPTPTVALLPGSPAIDGGVSVAGIINDQRGFTRTVGITSDVGAFESSVAYNPSFTSWRTLNGLAVDGSQDFANPSSDGVANVAKYAFNLAPNAGSLLNSNRTVLPPNGTSGIPSITVTSGPRLSLQFVRRKASTNPGLGYIVETSGDLLNWNALELNNAVVQSIDATWERVTITDTNSTSMRFGRVKVVRFDAYRNNFNSALGGASLRGTAVWTNQAVQLTDTIGGQLGAVVFDGVYAGPALNGFTARFNMNLGPAGQAEPADGISFAIGDLGASAWGEMGPGTARNLTINFDTYNNGGDGNIGMHVFANGATLASNPFNPFTGGVTVPVEITYDAVLGVTVKFNGATFFNQVPTPGFVLPSGSKFGIGGRTGGAVERAVVDDIEIIPR